MTAVASTAYLERLKAEFNNRLGFYERRPGILQLFLPLYHEDGDMLDIYLQLPDEGSETVRVCDFGMTLMRLSYSFELDTPKKEEILRKILDQNGIQEDNGNLYVEADSERLFAAVMQLAQAIAKVSSMRL